MYKRSDIKYDVQRGWIYLVSPVSSASGGVELELDSTDAENSENPSPAPSEPQTPLSGAPTPYRVMPSTSNATPNRPSRLASRAASSRIRSSFLATGRPVMPSCLEDNDSISAMLERGTLERDFALSMEALGFGDEPTQQKHGLILLVHI